MEPRIVVLLLVLIFLTFGPDQSAFQARSRTDGAEFQAWSEQLLGVLRNSSYGDFGVRDDQSLNLTGFRETDGYQWNSLPTARELSQQQYRSVIPKELQGIDPLPVYKRPVGELVGTFERFQDGDWSHRINLTKLVPGNDYLINIFQRNITDPRGEFSLDLIEKNWNASRNVQEVTASAQIWDESAPGTGWEFNLVGVHFVNSGSIILTTASDKYNAGFALPHFTLNAEDYNSSKEIVELMMTNALERIRIGESPLRSAGLFAAPNCEYIVWMQQHPIQFQGYNLNQTNRIIDQIERELEIPDGAPIRTPPSMAFSAVIFSPDCGFILQSELVGPKREIYFALGRRLLVGFILLIALQVSLLKRQMEEANTPSTRSRIAYQTIAIMAIGDGLTFSALLGILLIYDLNFLLVMTAAFVQCLNVGFLEIKFLFDLWTVQVGEPAQREYERRIQSVPVNTSTNGPAGLPLPATATRPTDSGATPIIIPSDQDIDATIAEDAQLTANPTARFSSAASFANMYGRFYFYLLSLMFLTMWAITWPRPLRSVYFNTGAILYLSFWLPQIYRNILRNCRKALSWEYILGSSILRLVPVVYWYFEERNIMSIDANPTTGLVLIGWVWLQVVILVSQQFLGPRFFLKDSWCPAAYEYHPILRDDDVEGGSMLPIGFLASASEVKDNDGKDGNRKVFDCAICMNEIDVPVVSKNEGLGTTWLEQKNYMVTPCRHIFHSECLEGWMNLRLVCPICREGLPPL